MHGREQQERSSTRLGNRKVENERERKKSEKLAKERCARGRGLQKMYEATWQIMRNNYLDLDILGFP